jgi:hypothetical protein
MLLKYNRMGSRKEKNVSSPHSSYVSHLRSTVYSVLRVGFQLAPHVTFNIPNKYDQNAKESKY